MKVKLNAVIPLNKFFFDFYTVVSKSTPTQLTLAHNKGWATKGKVEKVEKYKFNSAHDFGQKVQS